MICTKCEQDKAPTEFHKGFPWCKSCRKQYDRAKHREKWDSGVKKKQVKLIQERNRKFLRNYLEEQECTDCGEDDPIVLQFDHQRDKERNVSDMVTQGFSLEKISEEMSKCEIVCANCHARRTAKQFGWHTTGCGAGW